MSSVETFLDVDDNKIWNKSFSRQRSAMKCCWCEVWWDLMSLVKNIPTCPLCTAEEIAIYQDRKHLGEQERIRTTGDNFLEKYLTEQGRHCPNRNIASIEEGQDVPGHHLPRLGESDPIFPRFFSLNQMRCVSRNVECGVTCAPQSELHWLSVPGL